STAASSTRRRSSPRSSKVTTTESHHEERKETPFDARIASRRLAKRMAPGPPPPPRAREGADSPARRGRPPAPRTSVGPDRPGVPLRRSERRRDARRPLRRPQPAPRLPLHVRSGVERGLPELFVRERPLRRPARPPRASRRELHRRLARAVVEDRAVQEADGLALPVGLLVRGRLQLRLPRLGDGRGEAHRPSALKLPGHELNARAARGTQRHPPL